MKQGRRKERRGKKEEICDNLREGGREGSGKGRQVSRAFRTVPSMIPDQYYSILSCIQAIGQQPLFVYKI